MNEIAEVLKKYKDDERLTWEEMATELNHTPDLYLPVTRAQLNNWAVGVSKPDYYFVRHLFREGKGWIVLMANELIEVLNNGKN